MLPATVHQTAIENTLNGLMQEIAHCPIAEACLRDGTYAHPCQAIAASQGFALDHFHVPEPWSGHIGTAPLLFIGSNPSISQLASEAASIESEAYPRWHTPAEVTEFYFTRRFEHFMAGGTRFR